MSEIDQHTTEEQYMRGGEMPETGEDIINEFKAFVDQIANQQYSYKYAENQIISDFQAYIDYTYSQHYQTETNIQCFDAWIALDDATPTFRNTALKYLWRYGKKNGNNKDDLMKVLHYTIMCLYNDHYKDVK